jgi:membrane-associated phospholipid phosphatase
MLMQFITDFGDQAVVLPLAATVGAITAVTGWRRGAAVWCLAVGGALTVTLLLKLLCAACGLRLLGNLLHSPSGHTASAAVVYGGLTVLLLSRSRAPLLPGAVLAALFAAGIGLSRVSLGAHTLLEVLVGGAVGTAAATILAQLAGQPPPGWRLRPVCLAGACVLLLCHGLHLDAEQRIDEVSNTLWPFSICVQAGGSTVNSVEQIGAFR